MAEAATENNATEQTEESKPEETLTSGALENLESDTPSEEEGISHTEEVGDEDAFGKDEDELEFKKPDYLPEKYWDEKEGPRVESMAKSLSELEKKLSQGKHKQPSEYDTSVLSEHNVDPEDELVKSYLKTAGKLGLNQHAVDEILSNFLEGNAQFLEKSKASVEAEKRKLGGKADEIIEDAVRFQNSLVSKGVLSEEESQEYLKTCNTAVGLKMMRTIRNYFGESSIPSIPSSEELGMSPEEVKAQVGDPRYLTDPSYRAKVEKDFEKTFKGVHKGGD